MKKKCYRYRGWSADGRSLEGWLFANHRKEVDHFLMEKEIMPTAIQCLWWQSCGEKEIEILMKSLAPLLQAGLPLKQALVSIHEKKIRPISSFLACSLEEGFSFSQSMGKVWGRGSLESLCLATIHSAEKQGKMAENIDSLSLFLQRRKRWRDALWSSFAYPLLVGGIMCVTVLVLLTWVIPSMESLFQGVDLPTTTRVLLSLSRTLRTLGLYTFGPRTAVCLGGIVLTLFWWCKRWFSSLLLSIPYFVPCLGTWWNEYQWTLWSRGMCQLLRAQVPILEAFDYANRYASCSRFRLQSKKWSQAMESGAPLSLSMKDKTHRTHTVPLAVLHIVSLGEKKEDLGWAMDEIAKLYEERMKCRFQRIIAWIPSLCILCLAGVMAFLMVGVFSPLTDVSLMSF